MGELMTGSLNNDKEFFRDKAVKEAKQEVLLIDFLIKLLRQDENQELAITVKTYGIELGLVLNHQFADFLMHERQERIKCIDGDENKWE